MVERRKFPGPWQAKRTAQSFRGQGCQRLFTRLHYQREGPSMLRRSLRIGESMLESQG